MKWHYLVAIVNETGGILYFDGLLESNESWTGLYGASSQSNALKIGYYNYDSSYFNGSIDEVQIYNYSLSEEQIQANYQAGLANHSNDIVVSQEVSDDDVFTVAVTPTDGEEDGSAVISNSVTINNTPPTVTLTYPLGENITDRTPTFTWDCTDAQTPDCSGFRYDIEINAVSSGEACADYVPYTIYGITSYTPEAALKCLTDFQSSYEWAVRAYDGYEWSEWDNSTFVINSEYAISLENAMMNFGSMDIDFENDTTNNAPLPFTLNYEGNVKVNITYNATELVHLKSVKEM